MLNLVLNLIVFVIVPAIAFYLYSRKAKADKKIRDAYRIQSLIEDWKYYYLLEECEEQLDKINAHMKGNGCTGVAFTILSHYFDVKIDESIFFTEEAKAGVSRSKVLSLLRANFELITLNSQLKAKSGKTVESLLAKAEEEEQMIVCIQPDHIAILVHATKNKYVDLILRREYDFDKDLHKLIAVTNGIEQEEDGKVTN